MSPIEQFENLSKRILANRRNALKSTGPKSEDGKKRVSMNAFKHGLSGQKLFLQSDEYLPYFQLAAEYISELAPIGVREEQLAQHIIDSNWRLNRCAAMENNLISTGTLEQDNHTLQAGGDDDNVAMIGQALAWQKGAKSFEALSRHEARIARFMQRMEEQLEQLQTKRIKRSNGETTFVLEESRAWKFYNDSLSHHLTLQDAQAAAEEAAQAVAEEAAQAVAEEAAQAVAEEAAQAAEAESPQPEQTTPASAMALIYEPLALSPAEPAAIRPDLCDAEIESPLTGAKTIEN